MSVPKTEIHCRCGNTFMANEWPASQLPLECPKCGEVTLIPTTTTEQDDSESQTYTIEPSMAQCTKVAEYSDGLETKRLCPKCQEPMDRSAVMCIHCGWDLRLGKRRVTEVAFDNLDVDVSSGAGAGIPPERGEQMGFHKLNIVGFRADRLLVKGTIYRPTDTLTSQIGLEVVRRFFGEWLAGGYVFQDITERSEGNRGRIWFDPKSRRIAIQLNNGKWVCCRIKRSSLFDMAEIEARLRAIYGKRLKLTRIPRFGKFQALLLWSILWTGVVFVVLGICDCFNLI